MTLKITERRFCTCEHCQGSGVIEHRMHGTYRWQRRTYTVDCQHCGGTGGCEIVIITERPPHIAADSATSTGGRND